MNQTEKRRLLIAVMCTQGFAIGLSFGVFPVLLQPLEDAFSASRTTVSSGHIILMLAMSVGGLMVGQALDNGRPRRIMVSGVLLMSSALILAGLVQQLWFLGIAAFGMGLSIPAIGPLVSAGLITRFFDEDRGKALGLMSIGPPIGSGLFAAVAGFYLPELGWDGLLVAFGCLVAIVLLPLVLWAIPVSFESGASTAVPPSSHTMLDVLRQPLFYWTVASYALLMGLATSWTTQIAAFLATQGLDLAEQSMALAVSYWLGMPGALMFGALADRIRPGVLFAIVIAGVSACFALYSQDLSVQWVITLVAISGILVGGVVPLFTMLLGRRVGPADFGKAMGVSNLFILPIMAAAVMFAAQSFERSGGYANAVQVFAGVALISLLCMLYSNRLEQRPNIDSNIS